MKNVLLYTDISDLTNLSTVRDKINAVFFTEVKSWKSPFALYVISLQSRRNNGGIKEISFNFLWGETYKNNNH